MTAQTWLILTVIILINIAFFTLFERKIIGVYQARFGPNKTRFQGLMQPIRDGGKLFVKQTFAPHLRNFAIFWAAPVARVFLIILGWRVIPNCSESLQVSLSVIFLLFVLGVGVLPVLIIGWRSNRKFALLGGLRSVAQSISYEVSFTVLIFSFIEIHGTMSFSTTGAESPALALIFLSFPILFLWITCCIAETNRTPFDFRERERELVSGFNIEFRGPGFALIFIAEYGIILLLSFATAFLLLFNPVIGWALEIVSLIVAFLWVWIRCTLPRLRYDLLIGLNWKIILPLGLLFSLVSLRAVV